MSLFPLISKSPYFTFSRVTHGLQIIHLEVFKVRYLVSAWLIGEVLLFGTGKCIGYPLSLPLSHVKPLAEGWV